MLCFLLQSPCQNDSNEYIQHTIIYIKITRNYPKYNKMSADLGFLLLGTQEEFEIAVVNELSVFEPLRFYCNVFCIALLNKRGIQ